MKTNYSLLYVKTVLLAGISLISIAFFIFSGCSKNKAFVDIEIKPESKNGILKFNSVNEINEYVESIENKILLTNSDQFAVFADNMENKVSYNSLYMSKKPEYQFLIENDIVLSMMLNENGEIQVKDSIYKVYPDLSFEKKHFSNIESISYLNSSNNTSLKKSATTNCVTNLHVNYAWKSKNEDVFFPINMWLFKSWFYQNGGISLKCKTNDKFRKDVNVDFLGISYYADNCNTVGTKRNHKLLKNTNSVLLKNKEQASYSVSTNSQYKFYMKYNGVSDTLKVKLSELLM